MRRLLSLLVLAFGATFAVETDEDVMLLMGELPRPGNIEDILLCLGTNQVLWDDLKVIAQGTREEDEAQLKASWYAAVALYVFAVENEEVHSAIAAAGKMPESKRIETAKKCRRAPGDWQERPDWR